MGLYEAGGPTVQLNLRRAIITLIWAASLAATGPAIGFAQGVGDHLGLQAAASDQPADVSAYEPMRADVQVDIAGQAN